MCPALWSENTIPCEAYFSGGTQETRPPDLIFQSNLLSPRGEDKGEGVIPNPPSPPAYRQAGNPLPPAGEGAASVQFQFLNDINFLWLD